MLTTEGINLTYLMSILMGIIQGVAEFLPISSSGHLAVLQNVFNLQTAEEGHMFFDVLLHFGTLISIMIVYWKDIVYIVSDTVGLVRSSHDTFPEQRTERPGARMLLMLFFGTLPLFIILPFHDSLEQLYYKTGFIGAAFLLNGCLLYVSDRIVPGRGNERSMRIRDALLIGCAQAVATIPGISRSGSTITAGIATGQSRPFAMKYSLLMSVPAVLGANLLSLIKALKAGVEWSNFPAYLIGMIVSIVVGYFSIILLQRLLKKGKFGNFAYYMWGVGVVTLIASLF